MTLRGAKESLSGNVNVTIRKRIGRARFWAHTMYTMLWLFISMDLEALKWWSCDNPGNIWKARIVMGDSFYWANSMAGIDWDELSNAVRSSSGLSSTKTLASLSIEFFLMYIRVSEYRTRPKDRKTRIKVAVSRAKFCMVLHSCKPRKPALNSAGLLWIYTFNLWL